MHRGTPDGHITSEKPEHNRECRRVLRHVLALELHRAPSFRDLEACITPSWSLLSWTRSYTTSSPSA